MLEQAGTQAKYAVVWAERSPAVAGQRYYAAAGLLPVRCSARVQVSFVDINGAALAWLVGETAPAAVAGAQDPLVPGNYAPASAGSSPRPPAPSRSTCTS